jgi:hypothetical protein
MTHTNQKITIGTVERLVDHASIGRVDVRDQASLERWIASSSDALQALNEIDLLVIRWQRERTPTCLIGVGDSTTEIVVDQAIVDAFERFVNYRWLCSIQPPSQSTKPNQTNPTQPKPNQPKPNQSKPKQLVSFKQSDCDTAIIIVIIDHIRSLITSSWNGEGSTGELFGIEAVCTLLRTVLPNRQRTRLGLATKVVAKAWHVLVLGSRRAIGLDFTKDRLMCHCGCLSQQDNKSLGVRAWV